MEFSYNIALLIPMLEHDSSLLGHLWQRPTSKAMPLHWGQQYPELDQTILDQTQRHVIGSHSFSLSSSADKQKSTHILTSIVKAFGAADLNLDKLTSKSFSLAVELSDYVRPSIPRAVLARMHGKALPTEIISGGHWFACYAQHQATAGTLSLKYAKSDSFDLAAELAKKGSHGLKLEDSSKGEQLFSFKSEQPLVFGVSIQHLWEAHGLVGKFGNEQEGVRYVGV